MINLSWLLVLISSPSTTQRYYTELCGRGYVVLLMVVLHLYCHFRQIDSLVNHSTFSRCLGRTSLLPTALGVYLTFLYVIPATSQVRLCAGQFLQECSRIQTTKQVSRIPNTIIGLVGGWIGGQATPSLLSIEVL